jgi:predicted permease
LGATRGRIIRQLLIESLVLAGLGGGLGVVLAVTLKDYFRVFVPVTHLPVVLEFPVDEWVLLFTLLVSVCAGLIFGLAPAWQTARQSSWGNLTESSRGTTPGARSHRLRGLLVISEVALALIALTGAGLFLHSFQRARTMDPGFQTANVLLASLNLSEQGYTREEGKLFLRRARERIEAIPGVKVASFAEDVPLGFDGGSWEYVQVPGYLPQRGENMTMLRNPVAPRYFELMGIPLVDGREFTEHDDTNAPAIMVINETFARRYLAGQHPVGRTVRAWGKDWMIVGVARDIKYTTLNERPQPYFYVPLAQIYRPELGLGLHVRTIGPPAGVLPAVRRELRAIDPTVQIFETLTLSDYIGAAWFAQKIAATLLTTLGGLSLLLAAIGLFSVVAYAVNQRTHEIGIRMALGARAADVVRMILRDGLKLALNGMVVGLVASFGLTPLVASQLLGVGATDPYTFVGVSALLLAVVACACFIPARRAARVDPMVALRND